MQWDKLNKWEKSWLMLCVLLRLLNPELLLLRSLFPTSFLFLFWILTYYSSVLLHHKLYCYLKNLSWIMLSSPLFYLCSLVGVITQAKLLDLERKSKSSDAMVYYLIFLKLKNYLIIGILHLEAFFSLCL